MTINKLSEDSAKVAASLESIPKRIDSLILRHCESKVDFKDHSCSYLFTC